LYFAKFAVQREQQRPGQPEGSSHASARRCPSPFRFISIRTVAVQYGETCKQTRQQHQPPNDADREATGRPKIRLGDQRGQEADGADRNDDERDCADGEQQRRCLSAHDAASLGLVVGNVEGQL